MVVLGWSPKWRRPEPLTDELAGPWQAAQRAPSPALLLLLNPRGNSRGLEVGGPPEIEKVSPPSIKLLCCALTCAGGGAAIEKAAWKRRV